VPNLFHLKERVLVTYCGSSEVFGKGILENRIYYLD